MGEGRGEALRRVGEVCAEVRSCGDHEVGRACAALERGRVLAVEECGPSFAEAWEAWAAFLLREGAPAWEGMLSVEERGRVVDGVLALDGGVVGAWRVACVASEATVDAAADARTTRVAGRVARAWCAPAAVGTLLRSLEAETALDPDAVERFFDAVTRLPSRLGALGRRSPLDPGQETGDSTSLPRGCSRGNGRQESIHTLSSPREMIARPKMSQNEWKTTEIRGFKKLEIAHPFPAQAGPGRVVPPPRVCARRRGSLEPHGLGGGGEPPRPPRADG